MQQGQKSIGLNGLENVLFPLNYMYITQGSDGDYSHRGTDAIDCIGTYAGYPYYAPCSLRCIDATYMGSNGQSVWESVSNVNTPLANNVRVRVEFAHDNRTSNWVGKTVSQGDIIGYTGVAGQVTGDHVHLVGAISPFNGIYQQTIYGTWTISGHTPPYNVFYVNDTNIVNGFGYPWKTISVAPPVPVFNYCNLQMISSYNEYEIQCSCRANGNAIISYISIEITFLGEVLYYGYTNPNTQIYTSNWDKINLKNRAGNITHKFIFRDNYGQEQTATTNFLIKAPPPIFVYCKMRKNNKYSYSFQCSAVGSLNANIRNLSIKITFNGSVLYNASNSIDLHTYVSDWDTVNISDLKGEFIHTFTFSDNFGNSVTKISKFNLKGDDIIPLYMMNIIDGGFA